MGKPRECISADTLVCPTLNARNPDNGNLQAHIKTFSDGATEVLCSEKRSDGECRYASRPCHFESKAAVEQEDPITELNLSKATALMEVRHIKAALKMTKGNQSAAAQLLDISYKSLIYKVQEYGIESKDYEL